MSERKFTPGPWFLTERWSVGSVEICPDPPHTNLRRCNIGAAFADGLTEGEWHANALVMRAAPDMYDALEQAIALIEGWNAGATEDDVKRVMGVINRALLKANGES